MNKIFLGAILGISIVGAAGASIVSRGFFEEQIGNYATLDLLNSKANQSDLTALSDKIGVRAWSVDNPNLLIDSFPFIKELFPDLYGSGDSWALEDVMPMSYYFEVNNVNVRWPGLAGVTNKLLNGWTGVNGELRNPGLKAMYDGWVIGDYNMPGLYDISSQMHKLKTAFSVSSVYRLFTNGSESYTIGDYSGPIYPLWKLSQAVDKIGDLPIGDMVVVPPMFTSLNGDIALPTSLAELIVRLFLGNSRSGPIISSIYRDMHNGLRNDEGEIVVKGLSQLSSEIGVVPQGTNLVDMIGVNAKRIGTVPAGYKNLGDALAAAMETADKAVELAEKAIPDPRSEGTSGKFVLTVDVIGDSTTYHWEKIDRTSEEAQGVSQ